MYAAEVLTALKVTQEELVEEKSTLLASLIMICSKIKNSYPNSSFADEVANYYASRIKMLMDEASFEQEVNLKLTSFIENGNVSRLDGDELLDYITDLLLAFEECYVTRTEYYVKLESYFNRLLLYKALTSNAIMNAPEEIEPTISSEEKQKVLTYLNTLK